jgi:hypothetical protein
MVAKVRQATVFTGPVTINDQRSGTLEGAGITGSTGSTVSFDRATPLRHVRLTLAALSIAVLAANDFGGTKICNLPDLNIVLAGVEANLVFTKGGVTNGIVAATDLKVGMGFAVASAIPIATTAVDVMEATDLTTDALTVTLAKHTNDQASPALLFGDDSATGAIYLNVSATGGITANDTLSVTGTVDLYYYSTGNVTS